MIKFPTFQAFHIEFWILKNSTLIYTRIEQIRRDYSLVIPLSLDTLLSFLKARTSINQFNLESDKREESKPLKIQISLSVGKDELLGSRANIHSI